MSKKIVTFALLALMVLSMAPAVQAEAYPLNQVLSAGITNQVRSANQKTGLPNTPQAWLPTSTDFHAVSSGDTMIATPSDHNMIALTADFRDLYKRSHPSSGNDIARYDVWVDLSINHGTATGGNVHFLIDGVTFVLPQATNTDIYYLSNNTNDPFINPLKDHVLDFSVITVNNAPIDPELIKRSTVRLAENGGDWTMYYRLVIAEFDIENLPAISADYVIQSQSKIDNSSQETNIRVSYTNSSKADKPLYLKPTRQGEPGVYSVYTVNGILCIDYANDIAGSDYAYDVWNGAQLVSCTGYAAIPVGFQFYADAAATVRVPDSSQTAACVPGNSYTPVSADNSKFFVDLSSINYGGTPYQIMYIGQTPPFDNHAGAPKKMLNVPVKHNEDLVLGVWLPNNYGQRMGGHMSNMYGRDTVVTDTTTQTMQVVIEDANFYYRTADIPVRFRPLPRALITTQTPCTVSYAAGNATGGAVPFDEDNPYNAGDTVTVLGQGSLERSGYTFTGWQNDQDGKIYREGESFTILGNVTLTAVFSGGNAGGGGGAATYTVSFNSQGGSAVDNITGIYSGQTIKAPANPTRAGYTFTGWYQESACTNLWNFSTYTVNQSLTLYAGWEKIQEPMDYLTHSAYISGYVNGGFSPDANMTRAQAAQIFYNLLEGSDQPSTPFSDVAASDWYYQAVSTLSGLKIISGYQDGTFGPNQTITRAEFAVITARFANLEQQGGATGFGDVPENHWAAGYIAATVKAGYLSGYPGGSFLPGDNITRAESITLVNRMLGRFADRTYIDQNLSSLNTFHDLTNIHWAYYNIMEAANSHHYVQSGTTETWLE